MRRELQLVRGITSIKKRLKGAVGKAGCFLWTEESPVFLLSTGRTGTDTLHNLFSLTEDVKSVHEPRPQLLPERQRAYQRIDKDLEEFADIFKRARGYELLNCKLNGTRYIETSARLTFFAPVIEKLLPNAKFIYMYRHPGHIVRSGMRRGWYKDHLADRYRISPTQDDPVFEKWDEMPQFEKICWYWSAYNRFSLDFVKTINRERCLYLSSEDLFSGSEAVLSTLFNFIRMPAPARGDLNQVMSKKHNAQKDAEFPEYDNWIEQDKEVLFRYAQREILELGYGNDFELVSQKNTHSGNKLSV